jgi:hypothetical protein
MVVRRNGIPSYLAPAECAATLGKSPTLPTRIALLSLLALSVLAGSGCGRDRSVESSRRQMAESYGLLPGLSETPDAELQAELARIVEENATPDLLTRDQIPDQQNVAEGLADLFEPSQLAGILKESSEIFPPGEFTFDPKTLESAIRFRERYEPQRRRCREALGRQKCNFAIDYQAGFAAELSFVDVVRVCARLEAFAVAESLADDDDVDAAIGSLAAMFRLAACLGQEKHATARLQAALVREEALAVLQAIVEYPQIDDPRITRDGLNRLGTIVAAQLRSWPPDQDAWIGDRALGMHAYELVRAGRILELLTDQEWHRFSEEGILDELPAAAQRNVNSDELFYLQAMRRIIDACARPYFERKETLAAIRGELHQGRNSPRFPLVAGRLLLTDMDKGHALQARDRARLEAWALALAVASGQKRPPYAVSPLSGRRYEVVVGEGLVEVWEIGPDGGAGYPEAEVPNLAGSDPPE